MVANPGTIASATPRPRRLPASRGCSCLLRTGGFSFAAVGRPICRRERPHRISNVLEFGQGRESRAVISLRAFTQPATLAQAGRRLLARRRLPAGLLFPLTTQRHRPSDRRRLPRQRGQSERRCAEDDTALPGGKASHCARPCHFVLRPRNARRKPRAAEIDKSAVADPPTITIMRV